MKDTAFDEAATLCTADDRHLASAGVVILQDVLELVFYSLLIEPGVDETKHLESKSLDELRAFLKNAEALIATKKYLEALVGSR